MMSSCLGCSIFKMEKGLVMALSLRALPTLTCSPSVSLTLSHWPCTSQTRLPFPPQKGAGGSDTNHIGLWGELNEILWKKHSWPGTCLTLYMLRIKATVLTYQTDLGAGRGLMGPQGGHRVCRRRLGCCNKETPKYSDYKEGT